MGKGQGLTELSPSITVQTIQPGNPRLETPQTLFFAPTARVKPRPTAKLRQAGALHIAIGNFTIYERAEYSM